MLLHKYSPSPECYGIPSQFSTAEAWLCQRCTIGRGSERCQLCPFSDGALKKTDNGGWAHILCAQYIPEVGPIYSSQVPSYPIYIAKSNGLRLGKCRGGGSVGAMRPWSVRRFLVRGTTRPRNWLSNTVSSELNTFFSSSNLRVRRYMRCHLFGNDPKVEDLSPSLVMWSRLVSEDRSINIIIT